MAHGYCYDCGTGWGHKDDCPRWVTNSRKNEQLREKVADAAIEMLENLRDEQRPMPPEFMELINDNFWDLI